MLSYKILNIIETTAAILSPSTIPLLNNLLSFHWNFIGA